MKKIVLVVLSTTFLASACLGLNSSGASAQGADAAVGHGAFPVKITKTLESGKLKDGDAVEVETAGSFKLADGTLVPKGSKLEGHVTASKARSKGDPASELTLSFDKLDIISSKLEMTLSELFNFPEQPGTRKRAKKPRKRTRKVDREGTAVRAEHRRKK